MKPSPGTYRLTAPGAPPMDIKVNEDGTATSTLDGWDWDAARDWFSALHHTCFIRCLGVGSFVAYVGVQPGFQVNGSCTKLS